MNPVIFIAIAAALLAGYFAACYSALRTFSKSRLTELFEDTDKQEQIAPFLKRVPDLLMATAMARSGLNLVVLLAAIYLFDDGQSSSTQESTTWSRLQIYLFALLLAGSMAWVFSVTIPVSLARYYPEKLLRRSLTVLTGLSLLFRPVTYLLKWIDPLVKRITGAEFDQYDEQDLSDEIISVVEDHDEKGVVDDTQKAMLEAVVDFKQSSVDEIMTPRTDVEGIELGATLEQVRKTIIEIGHSRIPVYNESLDHITGVLYAKDLLKVLGEDASEFNLSQLARDAMLVPETKRIHELLAEFKSQKIHIAIVLDEYGGTSGLVTIEDILEELVGEIEDEYEADEEPGPSITRVNDSTVDVDARVYVDEFNDQLDVELPEDEDYDTVGGFVFSTLGHIPDAGEQFNYENLHFTVTDVERTKINRIRVQLPSV